MSWSFRTVVLFVLLAATSATPALSRTITDGIGRLVTIPDRVERVICSGPGCLRLLCFMQAVDSVIAVDDIEAKRSSFDARPYALANPHLKTLPVFGQFRGQDNPELILALTPNPQVIFKTYPGMGHDPIELQNKTGIPVVVLNYGNLTGLRQQFYESLRLVGTILRKKQRAEELVSFFEETIADLQQRSTTAYQGYQPSVFLGGVAFKGPHGFESTEPTYPPFQFTHARNLAYDKQMATLDLSNSNIAKEQIISWNPDLLFLDLATLQLGKDAGGLHDLRTDVAYRTLKAVREGAVYGLLPYNWYTSNYGSILANAYFIGKLLYPDHFEDIEPQHKADELYTFLVGKPVFNDMNHAFQNLAYRRIPLE